MVTVEDGGGAGGHVDGVRRHHCYLASRWFRADGGGSNEESRLGFYVFGGGGGEELRQVFDCRSFGGQR
jgi:hypothetical protein